MARMDFWRQMSIVSQEELAKNQVTIIGAGGIGSPTAMALAKMGLEKMRVYDHDSVEPHNLPNQLYRQSDLNKKKVEALAEICLDYAGVEIDKQIEMYKNQALSGIVVSGVDSMAARKEIWENIKFNPAIPLYIEARMGAEVARIHSINPCDPDKIIWYETTLYSDNEAAEQPCTERAIIYNVFMIASFIANQIKKYTKGEKLYKEIIFDLKTLTLLTA